MLIEKPQRAWCQVNGGNLLKVLQAFKILVAKGLITIPNKQLQFVTNSKGTSVMKELKTGSGQLEYC